MTLSRMAVLLALCLLAAAPLVAKADDVQAPSISSDGPNLALVGEVITLNEVDILSELASMKAEMVSLRQVNTALTERLNAVIPDTRQPAGTVPPEKRFAAFVTAVVDEQDSQLAAIATQGAADAKLEAMITALEEHDLLVDGGAHCAVHCKAGERVTSMCSDDGPTTCAKCEAGTFSVGGLVRECGICSTCAPGSTQSSECTLLHDTECEACSEGTFNNKGGKGLCQNCPQSPKCQLGHFMQQRCNPSTGEPVCSPCPAGSYMSDASDATECTACPTCKAGVPGLQCGGASKGVCVDPAVGYAPVGNTVGCNAWQFEMFPFKDNEYCRSPNEDDGSGDRNVCFLGTQFDLGDTSDTDNTPYVEARGCGAVDHGHSLNLYQTSSLKRVKGTPFTDPKYEKETGTPCGLLHYGRWSGDFEFIGGEWKFCNVAADGDLRVKVDGKVVIDTLTSSVKTCPESSKERDSRKIVAAGTCACGAVTELSTAVHTLSVEFANGCDGFAMDLRICPKVVVPNDEKSMARFRMNRTKVCVRVPVRGGGGTSSIWYGQLGPCEPSSKFKLNFEDFESDKGSEMRHRCNGEVGHPHSYCEVGKELCALFRDYNNGRPKKLAWEFCDIHPDSHPLFRRKAETGQIEVNVDRATDDGKWQCITIGDDVDKSQVSFAEKCDASDPRQIIEVLQVEAETGDFFPACYDL